MIRLFFPFPQYFCPPPSPAPTYLVSGMVSKSEKTAKMETRHSEAWAPRLTRLLVTALLTHNGAALLPILFCTLVHRSDWHLTLNLAPKGTISDTL